VYETREMIARIIQRTSRHDDMLLSNKQLLLQRVFVDTVSQELLVLTVLQIVIVNRNTRVKL